MSRGNYKNIGFRSLIGGFTGIFAVLIGVTITLLLLKGFPALLESLVSKEIQYAVKLSLITSTISTFICLIFSVPIAYGLARYDFWGKRIIFSVLQLPVSIPPIASGIALLLLFSTTFAEKTLSSIGLDPVFTVKGIVVAHVFVNVPYMIRILRISFEDINPRLEFVARTLGCSQWGSFFKVTLPLARNGLLTAIVMTWTHSLGEFGTVLMLAGTIRMKTETLPAAIFLNLAGGEMDKALAAATILILLSAVCILLFERWDKKH